MLMRPATAVAPMLALLSMAACSQQPRVPEPVVVVDAYANAIERGDADALWVLMSEQSRRTVSREELRRVLAEQKDELKQHAADLASGDRVVNAQAEVRFADGEVVSLDLDDGEFRVAAADGLPAAAKTPLQALHQLRRVLARRSYAGLLRVMSPRTRASLEHDLRSLVEGLTEPEALDVDVRGDVATVLVPGGHEVRMRREDGIWYIDDFD